ncbi:MAG: hypothetical protein HC913_10760 [Microscillaceae bacterium]|nr:hypothetical protein [Microscillaceae bacterium]
MKTGVENGHQASQKVSEAFAMIDNSSTDTLEHSRSILLASQQQKKPLMRWCVILKNSRGF